jgi:K+-transporting ATPase KdpF subunit
VTLLDAVGLLVAVGLVGYLVVALLFPDRLG